jgi:uncharacterized membrane protein
MRWNSVLVVLALGLTLCHPETTDGAEPNLAAEARAVFSAKCSRCHGPQLARPKSGFGYVLDLRRLAADREKVVPSQPDESGLWQLVENEEMPPPNSPTGALIAQEKEVIRKWIAAGAPAEISAAAMETPELLPSEQNESRSTPIIQRTISWIGKFHLLMLHFPIALLMSALSAEVWSIRKGSRIPSPTVRFCLGSAALSSVTTVTLGWLFALSGQGTSGLLAWHRWLGTITGVCAVTLAIVSELDSRRGVRRWSTRALILAGALLVGITGHLGGLMVHGKDFLDW